MDKKAIKQIFPYIPDEELVDDEELDAILEVAEHEVKKKERQGYFINKAIRRNKQKNNRK